MPPRHHVFHGDNVEGAVASAITRHFNDADAEGQIVFATHAVLSYVPYWANKRDWHVLVDEDLQVLRHKCHQLPQTHSIITDHIALEPHNSIYGRVVVRDMEELRTKGRNRDEDELIGQVAEAIRTLTNPYWDSFVNIEQFEKLRKGASKHLSIHSVLKPAVLEGFGSVFIAAADFQNTLQYRLWADKGVRFKEDREFASGLKFQSHPNGDLIDIYYVMESPWSKKTRDKVADGAEENDTNLHRIARATAGLFGTERVVWQANKAVPETLFGPNSVRLPNKPHGLNSYADIHNIAFVSALNPTPDHCRFLESLGLVSEEVRTAIYHAAVYQSVLRTSIRDTTNSQVKKVLVVDRGAAEHLHHRFPCSRIHKIQAGVVDDARPRKAGRPRKHPSNKDRLAEQRRKAKAEQLKILSDVLSLGFRQGVSTRDCCGENGGQEGPDLRAEKGIKPITNFGSQVCSATLYPAKNSSFLTGYLEDHDDIEFYVGALKAFHRRQLASKEHNYLISPAVFDPNRATDTMRGLENIVYVRHLWLDFEDGDLLPEELAALFPNVRLVVMNSYHHRSDKPRFRAFIPVDRPLTPTAYELLFDNIARKIEDAGYRINRRKKKSNSTSPPGKLRAGLDWSKRTPASLFYLPCQAADPSQSFFLDFNEPGREVLDPLPWIKNSVVSIVPDIEAPSWPKNDGRKINKSLVQQATDIWRQSYLFPGEGNDRFFEFARVLRRARLSPHEIESTLQSEAMSGRSPKKRTAQVKSIMNSLRKTRRRQGWG